MFDIYSVTKPTLINIQNINGDEPPRQALVLCGTKMRSGAPGVRLVYRDKAWAGTYDAAINTSNYLYEEITDDVLRRSAADLLRASIAAHAEELSKIVDLLNEVSPE